MIAYHDTQTDFFKQNPCTYKHPQQPLTPCQQAYAHPAHQTNETNNISTYKTQGPKGNKKWEREGRARSRFWICMVTGCLSTMQSSIDYVTL